MITEEFKHITVLLEEAVSAMSVADGIYIDCTFGRGGHSNLILQQASAQARLFGIDKDARAIATAQQLATNDSRFSIYHGSFADLQQMTANYHIQGQVDAILMDLGVSSPQLDDASRGFSFQNDGPLDMRMDTSCGISAAQWVNSVDESEMVQTFFDFGEEKYSRRIAKAIVERRQLQAFTHTKDLAEVIAQAHPNWQKGKHPATRVFQAIRILVNKELDDLQQALKQVLSILKPGGRLVVISFHSLEDRMVKRFMRDQAKGKSLPRGIPVSDEQLDITMKIVGKAIKASKQEVAINPRSRSAVMRVAQKL